MHHELRHTANKQSERQRFPTEDRVVTLRFLFITFRVFHWNLLRHVIPKLFKFTRGFIFYKENGAGSSINGQEGSNTFKNTFLLKNNLLLILHVEAKMLCS